MSSHLAIVAGVIFTMTLVIPSASFSCAWKNGRPYVANGRELLAPFPTNGICGWSVENTSASHKLESQLLAWALHSAGVAMNPLPDIDGTLSLETQLPNLLSDAQFEVASMPAAEREAWQSSALAEHAAISTFAKLSLELLVAGAPSHLVRQAIRAQEEELLHAQISFTFGFTRKAEDSTGSLRFPEHSLDVLHDPIAMREAAVQEGMMGEGHATLALFGRAFGFLKDVSPSVQPALGKIIWAIARDEARHAALAAQTVEWLGEQMGQAPPKVIFQAGTLQVLEDA